MGIKFSCGRVNLIYFFDLVGTVWILLGDSYKRRLISDLILI